MRSHLRRHLVGYLALFIALGGTSYAATLPRNSVGTAQIKRNAVNSAKVKNNSLSQNDLSAAARTALRGARGATGATGASGPTGPTGPTGATGGKGDKGDPGNAGSPGLSGVEVVTASDSDTSAALVTLAATADCPAGKKVIGGGVNVLPVSFFDAEPFVEESFPVTGTTPQGWSATVRGDNNDDWSISVIAICANAS